MRNIDQWYENGFRSLKTGNVLQTKDTHVALNRALRLRNDIQMRMLYTPNVVDPMRDALKLAVSASRIKL